jgi:hypothetical protein
MNKTQGEITIDDSKTAFELYHEFVNLVFQHVGNLLNCTFVFAIGFVVAKQPQWLSSISEDMEGTIELGHIISGFAVLLVILNSISFFWANLKLWSNAYQKLQYPKRMRRYTAMILTDGIYIAFVLAMFIAGVKLRIPT